jgi:hypothetical protein
MYVNGKVIPVQTIPGNEAGRGVGERRMVERVNSRMIHLKYCENFCKCHNVPPPNTIKKEKRK